MGRAANETILKRVLKESALKYVYPLWSDLARGLGEHWLLLKGNKPMVTGPLAHPWPQEK